MDIRLTRETTDTNKGIMYE